MNIKARNIFYKLIFLFLIGMMSICLYLLESEVGLVKLTQKYFKSPNTNEVVQIDTQKEYGYLRGIIETYYQVNLNESPGPKIDLLRPHFISELNEIVFEQYSRRIDYLKKNIGSQSVEVQAVSLIKDHKKYLYEIDLKIKQTFLSKKMSEYIVSLQIQLDRSRDVKRIASWKESTYIKNAKKILNKKMRITLSKGNFASVAFPCKIQSINPISGKNQIDVKLDAALNLIQFQSKEELEENSTFTATCHERKFNITLSKGNRKSTIFKRLGLESGVRKKRLSTIEKRNIGIREELKSWGFSSTKNLK